MKTLVTAFALSILTVLTVPAFATDIPKPESIAEKMSFKLVRGVTNVVTSPAEIVKQTMLTAQNHGTVGYVVGPIKGVGMTLYRCFIGLTETVFFMVPQPGYYDPMIDPEFVWHGWENDKTMVAAKSAEQPTKQPNELKAGDK
jgi:putative exosortase-associated protein (TIGR04073 family)